MDSFVRLKITLGNDSASEIQELYKLLPDRVWSQGDMRPNTKIIEKSAGCIFFSGLEKEASLDQHLEALLLRTKPVATKIKKLSERNIVEVWCAIYTDSAPPLFFDSNIVDGIANLGANFDIDLYLLPERVE
ncbi:MAG TPA: DUF4279 domain-containing protein [Methylobacter sp.]|jgi:hypothetical protein